MRSSWQPYNRKSTINKSQTKLKIKLIKQAKEQKQKKSSLFDT